MTDPVPGVPEEASVGESLFSQPRKLTVITLVYIL
jgi:hypothetical protein